MIAALLQGYGVAVGVENVGNVFLELCMYFRITTTISLVAGTSGCGWENKLL